MLNNSHTIQKCFEYLADLGKAALNLTGANSHKIDYVTQLSDILNPEGFYKHFVGSKVTAIFTDQVYSSVFGLVVEFYQEGSATTGATRSSF